MCPLSPAPDHRTPSCASSSCPTPAPLARLDLAPSTSSSLLASSIPPTANRGVQRVDTWTSISTAPKSRPGVTTTINVAMGKEDRLSIRVLVARSRLSRPTPDQARAKAVGHIKIPSNLESLANRKSYPYQANVRPKPTRYVIGDVQPGMSSGPWNPAIDGLDHPPPRALADPEHRLRPESGVRVSDIA
ncbi:hypothetical protein BDV95DRAFT_645304 [Massariosphaeria phaeospora]|uniref:Uncharacterized protein n=1 Tax=Massariosphaeria phaeospora TaxID=100035 RepID=A0A7C8MGH3_9PLEO|nr:hypothetical protein BDV95DRAFT_645304 [Massariosphaeria phaeospora]